MTQTPLPPPEICPPSVAAHDIARLGDALRNPLTALQGALDLLAGEILGPVPRPLQPLIAAARQNTHRFADLLDACLQAGPAAASATANHESRAHAIPGAARL